MASAAASRLISLPDMGTPLLEAFEDAGGIFAEALAEAATDEDGVGVEPDIGILGFEAEDVVFATVFCFVF